MRAQLTPLPRGIRLLTNTEAVRLNRQSPIAKVYTVENCVTCRGAKTFTWLLDGERVEYDCNCVDQYLMFRSLLSAGVPLSYQRLGWADYSYLAPSVVESLAKFMQSKDRLLGAGFGMVMHGGKGNGKTLLGNLLVKELIGEGIDCHSTTFADMVDAFAGGWHDPEREKWFNQTVRNARVLYIDDVGREYVKDRFSGAAESSEVRMAKALADNRPGSVKESLLEAVIRHRVGNCLPTFISTNFTPEQITTGYGGHTMSLLGEKSIFVEVLGQDRRQEIRRREEDYIMDGLTRPIIIDGALG